MSKKIVFMGTPEFAVPTLEALKDSNNEIIAVYSQPASKANRGQKLIESKIGSLAKKFSLSLRTPKTLDSDEEFKFFNSLKPDIAVVVAYGQIIPKRFLDIEFCFRSIAKSKTLKQESQVVLELVLQLIYVAILLKLQDQMVMKMVIEMGLCLQTIPDRQVW